MTRQHGTRYGHAAGLAPALLSAVLFMACGESNATDVATADDAAGVYAALSAKMQACADQEHMCKAAAKGDATAEAKCETEADACQDKAKAAGGEHARGRLHGDARSCHHSAHHCRSENDGGAHEHGMCKAELHSCVEKHAPRVPPECVRGLIGCLEDKGGRSVSDTDLKACVDTAHTCFMNDMPKNHGPGGSGHAGEGGHQIEAGHGAPGSEGPRGDRGPKAGAPAFPGGGPGQGLGHAGAPAHDHAGAGANAAGGDGRRR